MPYRALRAFTARQEQVIDGIRRGLTNQEIAAELGIAVSSLQGHIDRIVILLRNPDHLRDRECIFQFAWWREWHATLEVRETIMRKREDEALAKARKDRGG